MTATIERPASVAPVVMTTADGETRPADMWGKDSYTCTFCQSPVFGPLDWNDHEAQNAAHYEKRGESYTWEPYSYRARYWEAQQCANPGCVTALTGDLLASYRKREADRLEREQREARRQAEHDAAVARNAARVARRDQIHADVKPTALELGFAWCCTHEEQVPSYVDDVPMCEASGWDRADYDAHMRGHGARALGGVKLPKLRKKAPAASLPRLEIDVLAEITWTAEISVYDEMGAFDHTETAERRGQFWSLAGDAHSVWVLPYEPAPWETSVGITRAKPVVVYVGSQGRFHHARVTADWDRRRAA